MVIDFQLCSIIFQLLLFVCFSKLPQRAEPPCSAHISVVYPKGHPHIAYTLHVRNNPEKKWVSGGEEQLQRRGEEVRLDNKIFKNYNNYFWLRNNWVQYRGGCVSWHCFSVAAINNHYMALHGVKQRNPLKWSHYGRIQVLANQSLCSTSNNI